MSLSPVMTEALCHMTWVANQSAAMPGTCPNAEAGNKVSVVTMNALERRGLVEPARCLVDPDQRNEFRLTDAGRGAFNRIP
jgi:hypothetical protein